MEWKDGFFYDGYFLNNFLHGEGYLRGNNQHIYKGHFQNGKWTKAWKVRTKSIRINWGCDGKRQGKCICLCLPARGAPLFCPDDKKSEIKGELLKKKHFPEREEWLRAGLSFFLVGGRGRWQKESACQCRRHKRCGFDPWVKKIPCEGNGNPLQYSCLENPMDRGIWRATVLGATVLGVTKSHGWLSIHHHHSWEG